jgi:hypothetical protein
VAFCALGSPGFFTWHRAYLMAFEDALRLVGCQIKLPYWDWSSGPSTGVPAACREATHVSCAGATVANPLYSGPRPGGGQTARPPDIDTTPFDSLATTAQAAMSAATFSSFQLIVRTRPRPESTESPFLDLGVLPRVRSQRQGPLSRHCRRSERGAQRRVRRPEGTSPARHRARSRVVVDQRDEGEPAGTAGTGKHVKPKATSLFRNHPGATIVFGR